MSLKSHDSQTRFATGPAALRDGRKRNVMQNANNSADGIGLRVRGAKVVVCRKSPPLVGAALANNS
jgi:hypothetical protein